MKLFSPKTIALKNGTAIHFWYANNRGRGNCNLTIVHSRSKNRAVKAAQQEETIAVTRASSWMGNVCLSAKILSNLGVARDELLDSIKF